MAETKEKSSLSRVLDYWQIIVVAVALIAGYIRVESQVLQNAAEVEKIHTEIESVRKEHDKDVMVLNEEDDGVKGDLLEAVKSLKELMLTHLEYLTFLINAK